VDNGTNGADGIKMLRVFLRFWCDYVGGRLPRLQLPRHFVRAMRHILRFAHWANAQISSLGKTSKEVDLIYSFSMNKLLENAAHFIGKAPVMWEGRYMDLPLLGGDLMGHFLWAYLLELAFLILGLMGQIGLMGLKCFHFLRILVRLRGRKITYSMATFLRNSGNVSYSFKGVKKFQ
jgi:hypothetical protein